MGFMEKGAYICLYECHILNVASIINGMNVDFLIRCLVFLKFAGYLDPVK